MLDDLFNAGKSDSTIKIINSTANMIFDYAKKNNLIKDSPTEASQIPKKKITVEEIENITVIDKFLETEELREFLMATDNYGNFVYTVIIYLITFTGMRPGEAVALHEKDLLFADNTIRVTKTMYRKNRRKNEYFLTPPKTSTSIRLINVDNKIMEMIQQLLEFKKKSGYAPSEYIFTTSDGIPLTVDYLRQAVRRIGEKTTISKRLYTYILRHTHISMLAEVGVSLPEIMKRVGHKNAETTTQIYMHITKNMRVQLNTKINEKYGELMRNERK